MAFEAAPRLRFSQPVGLWGGGPADAWALEAARMRGGALVAVDGGANRLTPMLMEGEAPCRAVIGDLDSVQHLDQWRALPGVDVIQIDEQDTTDFEKALYSISAPLYLAAGFLGGRLDHSLAALHVMARRRSQTVMLIGDEDVAFLCPRTWRIRLPVGARVSFFPLTPCRARASSGLRWPVDGLRLEVGAQIGTSNEAAEPIVAAAWDGAGPVTMVDRAHLAAAIRSLGFESGDDRWGRFQVSY